jgi:hypothetical protein
MKDSIKAGDIYISEPLLENYFSTTNASKSFENDLYRIFVLEDNSILLSEYAGMSHIPRPLEINGGRGLARWVVRPDMEFGFMAVNDTTVGFSLTYYNEDHGELFAEIFHNGRLLGKFREQDGFIKIVMEEIVFERGDNNIKVIFEGNVSKTWLTNISFK